MEKTEVKTVCAWCKRLREGGKWIEDLEDGRKISHGICPECAEKLRQNRNKRPQK